ncbi:MAG: hypothetical protein L0338_35835 [Acidobacteria bacterium]|nr:hypothetical protein [Acidobacteriota bacterium]
MPIGSENRRSTSNGVLDTLFEMGAHAYYVHKHVHQFLAATDLAACVGVPSRDQYG